MTFPDRLRAVRRLALSSGDINLARECAAELRRQGQSLEGDVLEQAQEAAVPPKPRRSKVKPDGV